MADGNQTGQAGPVREFAVAFTREPDSPAWLAPHPGVGRGGSQVERMSRRSSVGLAAGLAVAGLAAAVIVLVLLVAGGSRPARGRRAAGADTIKNASVPLDQRATVAVARSKLGRILVDARGRTLYLFTKDKHGRSTCTGRCTRVWPPVIVDGAPTAAAGVAKGLLAPPARERPAPAGLQRPPALHTDRRHRPRADQRPGVRGDVVRRLAGRAWCGPEQGGAGGVLRKTGAALRGDRGRGGQPVTAGSRAAPASFCAWRSARSRTRSTPARDSRRPPMSAAEGSISYHFRPWRAERGNAWWLWCQASPSDGRASQNTFVDSSSTSNRRRPKKWQTELIDQVTWCSRKIAHEAAPEEAGERAFDGVSRRARSRSPGIARPSSDPPVEAAVDARACPRSSIRSLAYPAFGRPCS